MEFPNVLIYTTQTCGYCKATKEFFAKHNVPYKEIDVGNNEQEARTMIDRSGQMGVPVIIVGEGKDTKTIIGYDVQALTKILCLTL